MDLQKLSEPAQLPVVVKQLPIIEEQIKGIKKDIEDRVNQALSLACTQDNIKEIKAIRAGFNKTKEAFEVRRKEIKKAVLSPYEEFEAVYRDCVLNPLEKADKKLGELVNEAENILKQEKAERIKRYFDEYCEKYGIDFVSFEQVKISITLSASEKSLKDKVKEFLDKVHDDIELIKIQEHSAEIFIEYKATLNVSNAITVVVERHRQIERERQKQTVSEEQQKQAEAPIQDLPLSKPKEITPHEIRDEIVNMTFTVFGTLEQLKKLKEFMDNGGYRYE